MKVHSFACGRPIAPAPDCPSCSQWPPTPPPRVLLVSVPPAPPSGTGGLDILLSNPQKAACMLLQPSCPVPTTRACPNTTRGEVGLPVPLLAPAALRPWPGPSVLLASHFAPLRRKQEEFEARGSAGLFKLGLLLIKTEKPRAEGMPSRTRGSLEQHPEEAAGGEGGTQDTRSPGGKGPATPRVEAGAQQQTRASPTFSSQHLGSTDWGGRTHG